MKLTLTPLESRIAPAQFFVSGTSLTVKDAAANDAQNLASENAAQAATGATKAVLLNTGDSLAFDSNDNHLRDPHERVLVSVSAGRAMVFLSDGFGPTTGAFDENEISGLAVSDGFKGAIHTDVNGAVTTTLDAAGNFKPAALQNTSIASLTIDGRVLDDFVAGKNISNMRVGSGLFTSGPEQSVQNLFTGAAGDTANVKYSFSGPTFSLAFTQPAGASGGNISNVRLENGATLIGAGDGGPITSGVGNGGAGGSIVGLTVIDSPHAISVVTGSGGATVRGNGGPSGSIVKSSIVFRGDLTAAGFIEAGVGGDSSAGSGGKGGAISGTTINMLGDGLVLAVFAGIGGQASGPGAVAGPGGQIAGSTIRVTGSLGKLSGGSLIGGILGVNGGTGGNGVGTNGGPGGGIVNSRIEALDPGGSIPILAITGAPGGDSSAGHGGAGGAVSGTTVLVNQDIGIDTSSGRKGQADVTGGTGGNGTTTGGNGGAFNGNDVQFLGLVDLQTGKTLNITSGKGGNVTAAGVGGRGGDFKAVPVSGKHRKNSVRLNNFADEVVIEAGAGGSEATLTSPGSGGAGGLLNGLALEVDGNGQEVRIRAGQGGNAGTIGNGGAGGALSGVSATIPGTLNSGFTDLLIDSGFGGDGGTTKGTGGVGGNLANVTAKVNSVSETLIGPGGGGRSHDANGLAGGNLSGVIFENYGQVSNVFIDQGVGGAPQSGTGNAGNSGTVSKVTVNNFGGITSGLHVGAFASLSHNGTGSGGNGGAFSNITVNNYAHAGNIFVSGAPGTRAGSAGGNGNGGYSSSLNNITINDFASDGTGSITVESLPAGLASGTGKGGSTGSITNVSLFGPHTNFHIETSSATSGAGGGGNAGSISNVHGTVGSLRIDAGDGGNGTGPTSNGGNGGAVTNVNVAAVGDFVRWILAGNGGSGTVLGGNGGSISKVQVAGDIGDFSSSFAQIQTVNDAGMGGLIAGQAGAGGAAKNGSISQVTATRIAAILAGHPVPNNITSANAVESLTAISAQVIGADVDHDEVFDFTDAGSAGFNLGDGDTAIDGFVLVKHASDLAGLPVAPLKSISLVP